MVVDKRESYGRQELAAQYRLPLHTQIFKESKEIEGYFQLLFFLVPFIVFIPHTPSNLSIIPTATVEKSLGDPLLNLLLRQATDNMERKV